MLCFYGLSYFRDLLFWLSCCRTAVYLSSWQLRGCFRVDSGKFLAFDWSLRLSIRHWVEWLLYVRLMKQLLTVSLCSVQYLWVTLTPPYLCVQLRAVFWLCPVRISRMATANVPPLLSIHYVVAGAVFYAVILISFCIIGEVADVTEKLHKASW